MTDIVRSCALLDRREAAKLMIIVSVGLACAPAGAAGAADRATPFKDAGDELRAFMKLQCRADDGYTNYVNAGTVYAALPGRPPVPMYGYEGLLRFHTRVLGVDHYAVTFIEAGTYLDLATGRRLDRYQNPITGVTNVIEHIVEGPISWEWTANNLHTTSPIPMLHRHVAWRHVQGDSSLQFDNMLSVGASGGPVHPAAALVTYVGRTVELRDPTRASVADTVLIDASINPWAGWLAMGNAPGRLANNIVGRKLGVLSEAPARLMKFIAAAHPVVLDGVDQWKSTR